MKYIIGVDVGKDGGFCAMRTPDDYELHRTIETNNVYHDSMYRGICSVLSGLPDKSNATVIYENPFGMRSNWLNRAIGFLMGGLRYATKVGIIDFVSPGSWKKNMNKLIPEMKGNTKKDDYHRLIKEYLNDDTLTDDECAAYGIAFWGWCQYMEVIDDG